MPYQAEKDATITRVIASGTNAAGEATATYESVTYAAGAVLYENDIAPHIVRRLEEGDDHLSTLLRYIDDAEAREILAQQATDSGVDDEERDVLLHQDEREGDAPTIEPGWDNETSATEEVALAEEPEEESTVEETADEPETEQAEEVEEETTETEAAETEEPEGSEEEAADEEEVETDEAGDESGESTEEESTEESSDEQPAEETVPEEDLDSMSKRELNRKARALNIEGRTKMNEDQLRKAIRKAEKS